MHFKEQNDAPVIFEAKDLSVLFGQGASQLSAVDNISFKLHKGETLGIVGESGSGKTLTILSLMGLLPAAGRVSGELWFYSKTYGKVNLLTLTPRQWRELRGGEISMIFQDPMSSLNPVFSCGNQVLETILLHERVSVREAKRRTLELFEQVQLPRPARIFKAYPHEISGGQKQRVMIAMALACKPTILLADEPTTALDVTVQAHVLELLQRLRSERDTSIIFITHDLGVVAEIADRIMVMYKGKIEEQSSVWDIFSNPRQPYTKGLLACRPRLDLKLKQLPVVSDFVQPSQGQQGLASGNSDAKYNSVGEAIMMNVQPEEEMRARHELLIAQEPILRIENLKVRFPAKKTWFGKVEEYFTAVDDVSVSIYPGETLGLVGESGCGKSTLARCLLRLVEPCGGSIFFEGRDITKIPPNELRQLRKNMQIIFQDPYASLNPRISIGEAIMEPMRVHKVLANNAERKERAIELLEQVELSSEHFHRYPHEFSGGQRQRICIARTLALKPKFIICDESVSALDVSIQAQVLNLLNTLKEKYNFTYVFISHDLAVVKFISDRIMVMNKGKIEEVAFAEDIYAKPQKEYTKKLIAAIPKGDPDDIRKALIKRRMRRASS